MESSELILGIIIIVLLVVIFTSKEKKLTKADLSTAGKHYLIYLDKVFELACSHASREYIAEGLDGIDEDSIKRMRNMLEQLLEEPPNELPDNMKDIVIYYQSYTQDKYNATIEEISKLESREFVRALVFSIMDLICAEGADDLKLHIAISLDRTIMLSIDSIMKSAEKYSTDSKISTTDRTVDEVDGELRELINM